MKAKKINSKNELPINFQFVEKKEIKKNTGRNRRTTYEKNESYSNSYYECMFFYRPISKLG